MIIYNEEEMINNEGIEDRKSGNNICMNYVEDKHTSEDSSVSLLPEQPLEMFVTAECHVERRLELDDVSR